MLFSVALGVKSWKLRVRQQFQFKLDDVLFPSGNFSAKPGQLHIPEESSQAECSGLWFGFVLQKGSGFRGRSFEFDYASTGI